MLTLSDATPIPTLSEAHRRILRPFIEPVVLEAPFFVDFPIDLALTQKKERVFLLDLPDTGDCTSGAVVEDLEHGIFVCPAYHDARKQSFCTLRSSRHPCESLKHVLFFCKCRGSAHAVFSVLLTYMSEPGLDRRS